MLEKCIFDDLYPFVAPLLHNNQYGFRLKRSAALQLLAFLDAVYTGYQLHDTVIDVVYLDFSKAFDKINHQILLHKLKSIGVCGKLLKLIASYLTGRQQFVKIGLHCSGYLLVISGVPQGSILGPLLFLVYVMDLTETLATLPFMFADDTKLLSLRPRLAPCLLQNDLDYLFKWSTDKTTSF
jgi:ribonuclease P/MRP protein subunit RPP40